MLYIVAEVQTESPLGPIGSTSWTHHNKFYISCTT